MKPLLQDVAYSEIKKKIIKGGVTGNDLNETALAKSLKMSRTPIRAALQRLEYEGFIKIYSKQGVVVEELSVKKTNDMFEFRIAIETYAMGNVVKYITDEDIEALEEIIELQHNSYLEKDAHGFLELDAHFHNELIKISNNKLFIKNMENIRDLLFRNGARIFQRDPERIIKSLNEHKEILEAVKLRDFELSLKRMENHLVNGRNTLLTD